MTYLIRRLLCVLAVVGWRRPASSFCISPARSSRGAGRHGAAHRREASVVMMATGKKKRKDARIAVEAAGGTSKQATSEAARNAAREAESLVEGLLSECSADTRDLGAIARNVEGLFALSSTLKPSQSPHIDKDWRLIFVSSDETLATVGTGLHKLPLARMEEMFLTFSGGLTGRNVEVVEVIRVLGPFPNLRNTLNGNCKVTGPNSLMMRYTRMIDGTGKEMQSGKGELDRVVDVDVVFSGQEVLVLRPKGPSAGAGAGGQLVFRSEPDIGAELAKLRVEG
ncbi:unnamed protein product [Discosporangium mesarthrocarpum]